ncbi:hypothetical protein ACFLUU_10245, partial [Chloroflexota bacterium]
MSFVLNGKNLGEWGYIKPENYQLDEIKKGPEVSRLLWDAVVEYAKFNCECCKDSIIKKDSDNSEFPFGWGELQNQGVWLHSFYKALIKSECKKLITPEYAYKLKTQQDKSNNQRWNTKRMDFYIPLRCRKEKKETVLLIEYKHIHKKWCEIIGNQKISNHNDWEKLKEATKSEYRENFKSSQQLKTEIVKIALMIIVIDRDVSVVMHFTQRDAQPV